MLEALPTPQAILAYLARATTWYQLATLFCGAVIIWIAGRLLHQRLQAVVQPGVIAEGPRTAVRAAVLILNPVMLWLWLLAASAIFRRTGMTTDLLATAMPLVGALALIRMGVFVLRHSLSPGSRLKAYEGTLTVAIWLLVALHILGWLPLIEQLLDEYAIVIGKVRISLNTVASFALSIVLLLFVALALSHALHWRVAKSTALDESLKIAITKLGKFTLLTGAVVIAMVAAGIDLTAFAVFGGALGVGLGLGLQRIVSNFVSGVILAFEGSVRLGDVVTVGDTVGTVKALHARHVVVHTRDGLDLLLPNENLITGQITNWSYGDRNVRLRLPVQISYQDDPERAIRLLEAAALTHPRVLRNPAPLGCLKAFGDSGIDMELRAWVNDPENGIGNVRSEINRAIWRAFRDAGVTIPYPQRDVYLKPALGAATAPNDGSGDNRPGSAHDRMPADREDGPR